MQRIGIIGGDKSTAQKIAEGLAARGIVHPPVLVGQHEPLDELRLDAADSGAACSAAEALRFAGIAWPQLDAINAARLAVGLKPLEALPCGGVMLHTPEGEPLGPGWQRRAFEQLANGDRLESLKILPAREHQGLDLDKLREELKQLELFDGLAKMATADPWLEKLKHYGLTAEQLDRLSTGRGLLSGEPLDFSVQPAEFTLDEIRGSRLDYLEKSARVRSGFVPDAALTSWSFSADFSVQLKPHELEFLQALGGVVPGGEVGNYEAEQQVKQQAVADAREVEAAKRRETRRAGYAYDEPGTNRTPPGTGSKKTKRAKRRAQTKARRK